MNIDSILDSWRNDSEFVNDISSWKIDPARNAEFEELPENLNPQLVNNLSLLGINHLFKHQAEAFTLIEDGSNVVITTGTASGKTLCYDLPIINELLRSREATALFLFPTKALSQDQLKTLLLLTKSKDVSNDLKCAIYDGDTLTQDRQSIRKNSSIVITNPDMLHQAVLPHHTIWKGFFSNLRFVVLDEIHTYRGVFGSHIANVIRRLKRIAAFYHSYPQFIMTSATIGNPMELAEKIVEAPVNLIHHDGSPHGTRHFLVLNPPFVDRELGIRKSSLKTSVLLAKKLLLADRQILIFARSRRTVEMVLTLLIDALPETMTSCVRGYRSGYLKQDRRDIEKGFKNGSIRAVVATSALELGIDIGALESVLLVGYPGSIATTIQRIGRAGRKNQDSLAIMVASPDAMDQYLAIHPEYLTENSPENALIDPNNYLILLQHLRCATFELPFTKNDHFGNVPSELLNSLLDILALNGEVHHQSDRYYWIADNFIAANVSLRSTSPNVVSIVSTKAEGTVVIGEIDAGSATWLVHPEAIYLHEADSYEVKNLDLDQHICLVEPNQKDYFTIPIRNTTIERYNTESTVHFTNYSKSFGEISLRLDVIGYRKIRWFTSETIGHGKVDLPASFLETTGFWIGIEDNLVDSLKNLDLWTSTNNYGQNWESIKRKILVRDAHQCRSCGSKLSDSQLHVHHIKPFKAFENPDMANASSNLITLCPSCHKLAERNVRIRSGLAGTANILGNLAPLMVMCDREDIGILSEPQSMLTDGKPAILVYDNIPGGLGLAEKLYEFHLAWIQHAVDMIISCQCEDGCPACVGPIGEAGHGGKKDALALLEGLT